MESDAMWRIKNSGVNGYPEDSAETSAVCNACSNLGIKSERYRMGSPVNADSYHISAEFLDGGFYAKTGNYMFDEKGAWVWGAKAVLVISLELRLRLRRTWLKNQGLEQKTFESLKSEIQAERATPDDSA